VHDHVTRQAGLSSDRRLALDMAALTIFVGNREPGTRRNSRLLWLPGPRNVADGLTKYLAVQDLIVAVLSSGMYTVADVEQFVARAANIKQQYKERRSGKKKRRVQVGLSACWCHFCLS